MKNRNHIALDESHYANFKYADFKGNSMLPVLHSGDQLKLDPINDHSALEHGDILVANIGHEIITHRLIIKNNQKIFKGDRSLHYDMFNEKTTFALVTGFKRGPSFYHWGRHGQVFKGLIASASFYTQNKFYHTIRLLFLSLIIVLNFFSIPFAKKIKAPK